MIANPERTTLMSSLGWVERDALWRYDVAARTTETIPLHSGAEYCSLHASGAARFAVAHHFNGHRFEISVRNFSNPRVVLANAVVTARERALGGDLSVWADVPRLYVAHLAFAPWTDFVLLHVSPGANTVTIQRLEWYGEGYDKGYQGVVSALKVPGSRCALVSVQRSSRLILHDLDTGRERRAIDLAGRGGNPLLELREGGKELWATDYDTLVVLRTEDWQLRKSAQLQRAAAGTQQFIGDFASSPDEEVCVVARPFSGDVVAVDRHSLKIKQTAKVGGQPLQLAVLPRGEVVARDWKTGNLLQGTLKRRWFVR